MSMHKKPFMMGCLMAPMMLWMLHGQITAQAGAGWALALFVGAHVLVLILLIGAAVFAARLSPRLKYLMARLHRPSIGHLGAMMAGVVLVTSAIHLTMHGGI